jgi:hypothetical protein
MAETVQSPRAAPGDLVVITAHRLGEAERLGEILEVLGDPAHPHYRVRWEEGSESVFYPSNDAVIRRRHPKRRR